ncbi:MAG: hypothetical protein GY855_00505 [candidate division Zixibacteria bacterium]|nr:hypothetical protein [candidate division Zixibacteria bacterium]
MRRILLFTTVLIMVTGAIVTGSPGVFNFQGYLVDNNDNPISGDFEMTFRLYENETGDGALWSESHNVQLNNGNYTVQLGNQNSVNHSGDLWLSLQIDDQQEMMPRYRFETSSDLKRKQTSKQISLNTDGKLNRVSGKQHSNPALSIAEETPLPIDEVMGGPGGIDSEDPKWRLDGPVVWTKDNWGIARGNAGNDFYGDSINTMVSLGVNCNTGTSGQDYYYCTVNGGYNNSARHNYSTVGGGRYNNANTEYSTIAGGNGNNITTGSGAVICGGGANDISATNSAVVGGWDNNIYAEHGFIGSGRWNTVNSHYSTIAGGQHNVTGTSSSGGYYSFVGGGIQDSAIGDYSVVCGGYSNVAAGERAAVGGGQDCEARGDYSVVSGGSSNNASAERAAVGGGHSCSASGEYSVVGGGNINATTDYYGFVGGGYADSALDHGSTVGGGSYNKANATYSFVGGGVHNTASGYSSTVSGGYHNYAGGRASTIGGGQEDTVYSYFGGVASGILNMAGDDANDSCAFVGGGYNNKVFDSYATIVGGKNNFIFPTLGRYSFIGGGSDDTIYWAQYSVIGGGRANLIGDYSSFSVICGGDSNRVDHMGGSNVICGGQHNSVEAYGAYCAVLSGRNNSADGDRNVILGGADNTINGSAQYSLVFGKNVRNNDQNTLMFYDALTWGKLGLNRDADDGGVSYPIHVGTTSANGNGAYLSYGGTWVNTSSREFKENFQPLDGDQLLTVISNMQIDSWNYKDSDEKHIGPVAEDFVEAFDVGTVREDGNRENKYIAAGDVAGVALAGVKELVKIIEQQNAKIEQLERQVAELNKGR